MFPKKLFHSALATALVLAGSAGAAYAGTDDRAAELNALRIAKISLTQAITAAEQKAGGKAVNADVDNENGVMSYSVDVLKGNAVQKVLVDVNTGEITKMMPAENDAEQSNEQNGQESGD
jgi:uncharacterized membrane protein YkoI